MIRFVTPEAVTTQGPAEQAYASYALGLFFDDGASDWQPTDFRHVGLHHTASYILGLAPSEDPPRYALPDESRPIPDPYVCIAVQATTHAKTWTNPHGWREVVANLKALGYRVSASTRSRCTAPASCGPTSRTGRKTRPATSNARA